MAPRTLVLAIACASIVACAAEPARRAPSWLDDPVEPLPATLSELGLYPDVSDPSEVDARAVAYAPAFPLWSNGSAKSRYLVLPEHGVVESVEGTFEFPVGAAFFKTFAFDDDAAHGGRHYVETRVLYRVEEGWRYGAYRFRDDGSEADLVDGKRAVDVEAQTEDGTELVHAIPSTRQCRTCHESAPAPVLGFTPRQLALAHAEAGEDDDVLARLKADGVIEGELPEIEALSEDPRTAEVIGYVLGNCTHCHNGFAEGANSSFDLRPEVFLQNTIGVETGNSASGVGVRIVPGEPDESVLYLAFVDRDNGTGIKAMPPLGVQRRDQSAAERLRAFIQGLPEAADGADDDDR